MQNKYSLWLSRIDNALARQARHVMGQVWQERQATTDDGEFDDGEELAVEAALQDAVVQSDRHALSMPLSQARELCQALRGPCHAAEGPDLVSRTALEYLAALTGVSAVNAYAAKVRCRFASATLTYQGDFDAFKAGLRYGVSAPQHDFAATPDLRIDNVRIPEKTFDRQAGSDFLSTCRVCAELEFDVSLLSSEANIKLEDLVRECVALIGHEVQPVPVQRVNLQDVVLSEVTCV